MQLAKVFLSNGSACPAVVDGDVVRPVRDDGTTLADLLHAHNPAEAARQRLDPHAAPLPRVHARFDTPVDRQEIWAAGVTYQRSEEARKRESVGAAVFYDHVYRAERPELFFKAPAWRARAMGDTVHIRRDATWNVPEPELALVIAPTGRLVGLTIGNDMSSRDIEGDNPLYLPQAKFYDHACALGPVITLVSAMPKLDDTTIQLQILRAGQRVFDGCTHAGMMKRTFAELIGWLTRETSFPDGVVLLTGTGVVPPDGFTLAVGDVIHIDIAGIGRLTNTVAHRPALSG